MKMKLRAARTLMAAGAFNAIVATCPSAMSEELSLPANCTIGEDCFFQQFPDMESGSQAIDPFCGSATYDGHKGVDLRILSMKDMERGVFVTSAADGKVLRVRDGEPDHLVMTDDDRRAVEGRECGNGIVVRHGDGIEGQYCHLRQGSISVAPGDTVRRDDKLGMIGASGLAQFPHVHLAVRRDGQHIDPITGRPLSAGCVEDWAQASPLFSPDVIRQMDQSGSSLLAFGLAGEVVKHDRLVVAGPPPPASSKSPLWLAWGWFANLRAGDRIAFRVKGENGQVLIESTSDALDRSKAAYSGYAGKKGSIPHGEYKVTVGLVRDGNAILERTKNVTVE